MAYHEATEPPIYYAIAGARHRLGKAIGLASGQTRAKRLKAKTSMEMKPVVGAAKDRRRGRYLGTSDHD